MKLKCFYLIALSGACLLFPATSYADGLFHFGISFGSPDFRVNFSRTQRSWVPARTVVLTPPRRTLCTSHRIQRVHRTVHRTVHRHHWTSRASRVWVAPTYRTIFSGYDHCGRAIYRKFITRPGYYRTVFTDHCACGASN